MAQFTADARVAVSSFARRLEGKSATIGDVGRGVFLSIPVEGLEILDALAAGSRIGESVRLYEQAHGETPDIEDFLTALAEQGFVAPCDNGGAAGRAPATHPTPAPPVGRVSPAVSRRLFGLPTICACLAVAAVGLALLAAEPGLLPGSAVLVFRHHLAPLALALFGANLAGLTVHELAHLLAARAAGFPARIGIGHRLWILVAETDMSGIWLAPKRRRYLAFLAGPLVDAASAAVLLGILWTQRRGWVALSPPVRQFTGALLWSYMLRLLWQCFVFVRTDFYYVLATALDCKRLLGDTEDLLRNRLARLRSRAPVVDQSAIPPRELSAIRAYAIVWLAGRAVALAALIFISVPVFEGYGAEIARALRGAPSTYGTVDLLTLAALSICVQGGGLFLWLRSFYRSRTQRRAP